MRLNRITHDLEFHSARDYTLAIPSNINSADAQKFRIWPINGADKVAQQIKINLLSLLGEWFLDIRYGVPYLEEILVKNPRLSTVETILRNHIGSVPDVIRIDSFGMDWSWSKSFLTCGIFLRNYLWSNQRKCEVGGYPLCWKLNEFFAYGQWWETEVILASTPYAPRMIPAPVPILENYESTTMSLFRKMEVLSYVRQS